MSRRVILFSGILACALVFLGAARASIHSPSQNQDKPGDDKAALIAQGKARYLHYKCDECHGPNGEGTGDAPDLIGTQLSPEEISKFLEKPSPDAEMKGMPSIPADNPDHQPIVAFIVSIKRSSSK